MIRSNFLLRSAVGGSSVLLVSGFICYPPGAFHWLKTDEGRVDKPQASPARAGPQWPPADEEKSTGFMSSSKYFVAPPTLGPSVKKVPQTNAPSDPPPVSVAPPARSR